MKIWGRSPRSSSAGISTDIAPASYAPRAPPPESTSPTRFDVVIVTRKFGGLPPTPLAGICSPRTLQQHQTDRGSRMAARTKAAKKTATKAGKAAAQARTNPYVQRFIEDPELRENVRSAYESVRKAVRRMQNGKG